MCSVADAAELAGIFAGDGTIYKTTRSKVLEIRGALTEQEYYSQIVAPLFSRFFAKDLKVIKRSYTGGTCVGIRICGEQIYQEMCKEFGFPLGRKENTVNVPSFVMDSKEPSVWVSYLRGVFDTDGSIYLRNGGRSGKQPVIEFRSVSQNHINSINCLLKQLGFNSWKEKNKVRAGGWSTVFEFFNTIAPHNPKHKIRFANICAGIA